MKRIAGNMSTRRLDLGTAPASNILLREGRGLGYGQPSNIIMSFRTDTVTEQPYPDKVSRY